MAVARFQGLAHESEVNVPIDEPQEMIFGNVVCDSEVVEQRLRTSVLTHHDQRASVEVDRERHSRINEKTFFGAHRSRKHLRNIVFYFARIASAALTHIDLSREVRKCVAKTSHIFQRNIPCTKWAGGRMPQFI